MELAHWTYRNTCLLTKSNQQYIQFIPLLSEKTEKEFTNLVSEAIHSNYLIVGYW